MGLKDRAARGFMKIYTRDKVMVAYAVTEGMHTSEVGNLVLINWENYEPLRSITDQSGERVEELTYLMRTLSKSSFYGDIKEFKGIEAVADQYGLTKLGDKYYSESYQEECKEQLNGAIDYFKYRLKHDGITNHEDVVMIAELDYPEQVIKRCITVSGMYCVGSKVFINLITYMLS